MSGGGGEVKVIQSSQDWTVDSGPISYVCWYNANISIQIPTNEDTVLSQAEATDQTEKERMGTKQTSQYIPPWAAWTFSTTSGHTAIELHCVDWVHWLLVTSNISEILNIIFQTTQPPTSIPLSGFPIEFIKASYWLL